MGSKPSYTPDFTALGVGAAIVAGILIYQWLT